MNPISVFREWWDGAMNASPLRHKGAVCISTVDPDGFPDGRFVDLKEIDEDGLVFCTPLDSAKGRALARDPRVGLTVWWDHVERQVRVRGRAERIADEEADRHWAERPRDAHLTTWACQQSEPLESDEALESRLSDVQQRFEGKEVPRPATWGGFRIRPESVEFLEFRETRLHGRVLYRRGPEGWTLHRLQP